MPGRVGTLARAGGVKVARALSRLVLRLAGWRLLDLPTRPRKAVVLGYPHTSNWDFVLAMLGLFALDITPRWAGKDTMFAGWRGPLMRALGGIPVNRRERTGFVDRMTQEFGCNEDFLMVIAPEGTRALTTGWKSGFLRIAHVAGVPVVPAVVDYPRRELGFLAELPMSGDDDADMAAIAAAYAGRQGCRPENTGPIRLIK